MVYDPMITWYKCGQPTFSSCDDVGGQRKAKMDKSTIERKNQTIRIKADKPPKMRNYFNTPKIKVYNQTITWYNSLQSTFSSCDHICRQWKAKMDKSTSGWQNQRISIKADKTPQNEKIVLILQQSRYTIPWSPDTSVDNQHSRHAMTWVDREKQKWTKKP